MDFSIEKFTMLIMKSGKRQTTEVIELLNQEKATFSIATTPRFGEGATPFSGLLYFNLDHYLIMLSIKQGSII